MRQFNIILIVSSKLQVKSNSLIGIYEYHFLQVLKYLFSGNAIGILFMPR